MNRNLYRTIFSKRVGMLVPVAEVTPAQGKGSGESRARGVGGPRGSSVSLALAVAFALWGKAAFASPPLPTGGVITSGTGSISQSGHTLTVNQSSQNLAANWQSFDIGADHAVVFNQPNSSSVALNRVVGPEASSIYGSLSANGHVFLVNPNGVLFAPGAQVSAGGFVASTLNLSDEDFAAGRYRFTGGTDAGSVVNEGTIDARSVALIGPKVVNSGTIRTPGGNTTLAAGDQVTVSLLNGLLTAEVDAAVVNAQIEHSGQIVAEGGRVSMLAGRADAVLDSLINVDGIVQASSIRNQDGKIYLDGGAGGTVYVHGELDVSGTQAGAHGGDVTVLGKNVGLMEGAHIDASGDAGGGTVLIGGGPEGKDPALHNATATFVGPDATVAADALSSGDGGTVIVYSRDTTRVHGALSARGGVGGGSGGFVETSGGYFEISRTPDIAAPAGQGGTWLIDPSNITVTSGNGASNINTSSPFQSSNHNASLGIDLVNTALGSGDVIIRTGAAGTQAGDIFWNVAYTYTGTFARTLTQQAQRDIVVTQNIASSGGALNLAFAADSDGNGTGGTVLSSSLTTNGGSMTFGGVGTILNGLSAQTMTTSGGAVTFGGEVLVANPSGITISTNGGNVTFARAVDSGNRYTLDSTTRTWDSARTTAQSGTGAGVGDTYLATVTSALESSAVTATSGGSEVWLGGNDAATEGTWRWVTGPEGLENGGLGRIFLLESSTTRGRTGYNGYNNAYVNFAPGEPNNYGGTEDYLSGAYGTAGLWNDYPGSRLQRSVVETNLAPSPLTINAGTGTVTFSGAVGSNKPLASLNITANTIAINGGAVTTTGLQTYSGNVTLGSASTVLTQTNADTDFTLQANRSITNASGGAAALAVRTTGNIVLGSASSISSSTGALNVTLNADSDATSSGGIRLDSNASIVSNGGAITLSGGSDVMTGYAYGSTATNGRGIWLRDNTILDASGSTSGGNIILRGSGGAAGEGVLTGWNNTVAVATIRTSHSGAVDITGRGGGQAAGRWSSGVSLFNTLVQSDSGGINITGTGGSADGADDNSGILLNEVGAATDNRIVSTSGAITLTGTRGSGSSTFGSGVRLGSGDHRIGQDGTLVANSSSAITLQADTMRIDSGTLQSSGALTVRPLTAGTTIGIAGGAGTLSLPASYFATNFADGFSSLTIGSSTAGAITVGGATTVTDDTTLVSSGDIHLDGALNAAGQTLTLTGGNGATVSGSGGISASGLLLNGNNVIYNLNTATTNSVSTLAAINAASMNYRNSGSLTVGAVGGIDGVTASGAITLESNGAGADLTLDRAISSTNGDIVLAAGRHFINNNATDTGINPGVGRYLVYSTHPTDSVEAMTGYSKRYAQAYVPGSTPTYATAGNWFLYSVVPVLTVTPGTASATYGNAPPPLAAAYSGFIDGDTSATAGINGSVSLAVAGPVSTGGYLTAGAHDVSYTHGLSSSLGYVFQDDAASINELTITPRPLTVTVNDDAKLVTQSDAAGYHGVSYSGWASGENENVLGGTLDITRTNAGTEAAGEYAGVLQASGLSSGNYDITYVNGDYQILPAQQLLVRIQNLSTDYGTALQHVISSVEYLDSNGATINTLTLTARNGNTFRYSDGAGGSVTFTVTPEGAVYSSAGHLVVGNYELSGIDESIGGSNFLGLNYVGNLTVAPIELTPQIIGSAVKLYDGTTAVNGVTLTLLGNLAGDQLLVDGTGAFDTRNAGSNLGYTIGNIVLSGADAGNYYLSIGSLSGSNGMITPRMLTVNGITANDRIYDGTTAATLTTDGYLLDGLLTGDTVLLHAASYSALFDSKHIGTNKAVTVSGLGLSGADAGNYLLTQPTGLTASITPRPLTIVAVSNIKIFDGSTSAAGIPLITNGALMTGDQFITLAQAYETADVGTGLTLMPIVAIDDGNGGANYALTLVNDATGEIRTGRPAITDPSLAVSGMAAGLNGDGDSGGLGGEGADGNGNGSSGDDGSGESATGCARGQRQQACDGEGGNGMYRIIATGLKLPEGLAARTLDGIEWLQ